MAIVKNDKVIRAGLMPGLGSFPHGAKLAIDSYGWKHDPKITKTGLNTGLRPLPYSLNWLRTENVVSTGYYTSQQGLAFHSADKGFGGCFMLPSRVSNGFAYSAWETSGAKYAFSEDTWNRVCNRARAKLLEQIELKLSEWMTSLAEGRQTARMVQDRSSRLNRAAGYLADGTVKGAEQCRKELRIARRRAPPTWKVKTYLAAKDLGGLWLEYWMGWAPLFGDIVQGVKNLAYRQGFGINIGDGIVSAASGTKATPRIHAYGSYERRIDTLVDGFALRKIRFRYISINNNERMLRELGLTNPWVTIHDIIPWSWLLAWGHNLRDVLKEWDDLNGVEIDSSSIVVSDIQRVRQEAILKCWDGSIEAKVHSTVRFVRSCPTALPGVRFRVFLPRLNLTRAATSVSLLFQKLAEFGIPKPRRR